MRYKPLPRYLRVAHWLHEQQRPVSSREVADIFSVPIKAISDDFAKIRRRPDIMDINEQKIRHKGVQKYLLHILNIHPYRLDERQYPHRQDDEQNTLDASLIWRKLLSHHWHQMVLIYRNHDTN